MIINPGFPVETRWAYRRWDELSSLTREGGNVRKSAFFSTLKNWQAMKEFCENDFQKAIYPAYPVLEKAHHELLSLGAKVASLSGSGPSLFGLCNTKEEAKKIASHFSKKKWLTWVTKGN